MAKSVEVTSRELKYGIEAARVEPQAISQALQFVRERTEGFLASSAILAAAAHTFHLVGYSYAETLDVIKRGLEELGVPVE